MAGVEFKKEDRGRTKLGQDPFIRDRRKRIPKAPEKIIHLGMLGVVLQCLGLLWLLSAAGFTIPWYSIIPMAIMIAGGVFIVKATIRDEHRTEGETIQ